MLHVAHLDLAAVSVVFAAHVLAVVAVPGVVAVWRFVHLLDWVVLGCWALSILPGWLAELRIN